MIKSTTVIIICLIYFVILILVGIISSRREKKHLIIWLYTGECWYCGNCVVACPVEGAIELRHPLMDQVHWIEKS